MNANSTVNRSQIHNDSPKYYVPSFHFDMAKSCYCHSGKLFGSCCGSPNIVRERPNSIHVINNFISQKECKRLIRFAEKQKRSWLSVVDPNKSQARKTVHKRDPSRVTQHVSLGKKQPLVNKWMQTACLENISALTKTLWFEPSQLLRYGPGGKYAVHSDAEHYDFDAQRFYRFIDRDFSILIYLNDDFEGGELKFPWLNYQYRPVAGDLVFFPSNHLFSHESMPIISGNKYALVSWGAFQGSPRVKQPRSMVRV
ncbi:MAG: putative 2-oxoglutarate/Fe(II)-dependent dioxygenase YbiX [Pseudohongiellaceae bacterium]|jgi:predicted 2-oxoglutarate/Fe(II)-dependent dioxygenase YbiX